MDWFKLLHMIYCNCIIKIVNDGLSHKMWPATLGCSLLQIRAYWDLIKIIPTFVDLIIILHRTHEIMSADLFLKNLQILLLNIIN